MRRSRVRKSPRRSGRHAAFILLCASSILTVGCPREGARTSSGPASDPGAVSTADAAAYPPALRAEIAAAEDALRTDPGSAETLSRLGQLYHANGFPAEAAERWRDLTRLEPDEPRWHYLLADAALQLGRMEPSHTALRETVERAPDYSPAWLRLGNHLMKTGQSEPAADCFRKRLELIPADPHATLGLARLSQRAGRKEEAVKLLEESLGRYPDFPSTRALYAVLLEEAGDAGEAARQRARAAADGRFREAEDPWLDELSAFCRDYSRLLTLADIQLQSARGDFGRQLVQQAITLQPERAAAYEMLGRIQLRQGQRELARETLRKALALPEGDEASVQHYFDLSLLTRALGDPADALEVAAAGLALHPRSHELENARGQALVELGRGGEALAAFQKALELSPNDPVSNYNLGLALEKLGRGEEALQAYRAALQARPAFLDALTTFAARLLERGALAEAKPVVDSLLTYHPDRPQSRVLTAQWHSVSGQQAAQGGDARRAEAEFRRALELSPGTPDVHAQLGEFLLNDERAREALPHLQQYERMRPTDARALLMVGLSHAQLGRFQLAQEKVTQARDHALKAGQSDTAAFCTEILAQLAAESR